MLVKAEFPCSETIVPTPVMCGRLHADGKLQSGNDRGLFDIIRPGPNLLFPFMRCRLGLKFMGVQWPYYPSPAHIPAASLAWLALCPMGGIGFRCQKTRWVIVTRRGRTPHKMQQSR